jgi:hypothetical protein
MKPKMLRPTGFIDENGKTYTPQEVLPAVELGLDFTREISPELWEWAQRYVKEHPMRGEDDSADQS